MLTRTGIGDGPLPGAALGEATSSKFMGTFRGLRFTARGVSGALLHRADEAAPSLSRCSGSQCALEKPIRSRWGECRSVRPWHHAR